MKPRKNAVKIVRFQTDEHRQRVSQIEVVIGDFERIIHELETQIVAEQDRTGIADINHFAYSTAARAALQRRDNLQTSVEGLRSQLEQAQQSLEDSIVQLQKYERIEQRSYGDKDAPAAQPSGTGVPVSS